MTTPWLSVICPTIGRDTLARTLRSVRRQAPPAAVEVLVVGDTHAGTWAEALTPVPLLCAQYGARYLPHDGGAHCVGHPQREYGATQARGRWLLWTQDDSILLPGAVAAIQTAVQDGPRGPYLFRAHTWQVGTIWVDRALRLTNVDADMLCSPNEPARLGAWAREYAGDFAMIRDTVALWGGEAQWHETVISHGRPKLGDDWTR